MTRTSKIWKTLSVGQKDQRRRSVWVGQAPFSKIAQRNQKFIKLVNSVFISKMKQQTHDKLNVWRTRKKSEPQMGFEPTTLRDLVGCSNH